MRTVFLVPRRADNGHRDALWAWCKARWQRLFPGVQVYEGHHNEGLFSRSAAINRAARLADADGRWDFGIVIDADILVRTSQLREALARASKTGRVTWAHRRWRGVNEEWTAKILKEQLDLGPEIGSVDIDVLVERTTPLSWSCCIVIPRGIWDETGGFDERFRGWGFEDIAWQSLICGLYGWERIEGDVIHLWHPRSEERIVKGRPSWTASPEYLANGRLGRRYMYALRRDHGLTDRPEPASPDEIKRDLENLVRDDEKFAQLQDIAHVPKADIDRWTDWWPTLAQLRDGAREASRTVSVVVHSGGDPAAWPERKEYLRQSLASLAKMVRGPIVQRVLYSDWGASFADELAQIAGEHGFYVVGDGHHGYTGSMRRMWGYLSRRAMGAYIFMCEDDFLYARPVDLTELVAVLQDRPYLAQLALLREAYYPREFEQGGILGWPRAGFSKQHLNGTTWLEHRNFFTANPSLFRRSLAALPWPAGPSSERLFGDMLLKDPAARFGFLGSGTPSIAHIGKVKAGSSY